MTLTPMKCLLLGILLLSAVTLTAQRPGYGGNSWQIKDTLLTGTPVAISSMAGNPPPPNVNVWVCQGGPHSANAAGTDTITITAGDSSVPWPAVKPWPNAPGGSAAVAVFWSASSSLACEWMPAGMLVSASGSGVYIKASGIY